MAKIPLLFLRLRLRSLETATIYFQQNAKPCYTKQMIMLNEGFNNQLQTFIKWMMKAMGCLGGDNEPFNSFTFMWGNTCIIAWPKYKLSKKFFMISDSDGSTLRLLQWNSRLDIQEWSQLITKLPISSSWKSAITWPLWILFHPTSLLFLHKVYLALCIV